MVPSAHTTSQGSVQVTRAARVACILFAASLVVSGGAGLVLGITSGSALWLVVGILYALVYSVIGFGLMAKAVDSDAS